MAFYRFGILSLRLSGDYSRVNQFGIGQLIIIRFFGLTKLLQIHESNFLVFVLHFYLWSGGSAILKSTDTHRGRQAE